MRSKIVADEVCKRWPNARVEFVLNSHAPYAQSCPYRAHLVDDTPTKHITAVNQLITQFKPDVVIFDASGRKAQLKHANLHGAKVVFISQHRRKRARGMRIERALVTDSHWVVQPEFVIGDINWLDKLKLNLIKREQPIFTGSIFANPTQAEQAALQQLYQVNPKQYLLYSAGSGGHKLKGGLAADLFAQAALAVFKQTGVPSLMVFGPNYPKALPEFEGVTAIKQLNTDDFINLLDGAKAAVLSGGDTLLQAIALNVPTLAVAVSKDQPSRIKQCTAKHLALGCDPEVGAMSEQIMRLLQEDTAKQLTLQMQQVAEAKGLDICMAEISRLLGYPLCK